METVIIKKEVPNPWVTNRYAIAKDRYNTSTRELVENNYEVVETTIKNQEEFIKLSRDLFEDNERTYTLAKNIASKTYTVKKLIML